MHVRFFLKSNSTKPVQDLMLPDSGGDDDGVAYFVVGTDGAYPSFLGPDDGSSVLWVEAGPGGTRTQVTGSDPALLGTYVPRAGGSVATTAPAPALNVKDFGAIGDGVANDAAAIRAAIAAVPAGGGSVWFPPGTYRVVQTAANQYFSLGNRVTLEATKGTAVVLIATDAAGQYREGFRNYGDYVTMRGLTIRRSADFPCVLVNTQNYVDFTMDECTLDGRTDTFITQFCHGVQYGLSNGTTDGILIDSCTFDNLTNCTLMSNASTATVRHVVIRDCKMQNVDFNAPNATVSDITVTGCTIDGGGSVAFGVAFAHVVRAAVRNCTIKNFAFPGVHIEDYSSQVSLEGNRISACATGASGSSVVRVIAGCSDVKIVHNMIDASANTNASAINVISAQAGGSGTTPGGRPYTSITNLTITENTITGGPSANGIYLEDTHDAVVSGNVIKANGSGSNVRHAVNCYNAFNSVITGNVVAGWYRGILPQTGSVPSFKGAARVTGNLVDDCDRNTAILEAGSDPGAATGANAAVLMNRLAMGVENAALLILGDSTGLVGTPTWPARMATWIGQQFPEYTVNFRSFDHATQAYLALGTGASVVVQTGTGTGNAGGPFVLDIYDGSVSGANVNYPLSTAARWAAMIPATPQLIITSYSHNSVADTTGYIYTHWPLLRSLSQQFPNAGLIQTSQNPRGVGDTERANGLIRCRTVADFSATEGWGLVNVTRRYLANPSYTSEWLSGDLLHPNTAGISAWWEEVRAALTSGMRAVPRNGYGRQNSLWIPATGMFTYSGTPTLALTNSGQPTWALPQSVDTEVLCGPLVHPATWKSGDAYLYWHTTVTSGNVQFELQRKYIGGGVTTVGLTTAVNVGGWTKTHAGTIAGAVSGSVSSGATHVTPLGGFGDQTNIPIALRIKRTGSSGTDTVAAPVCVIGVLLERAA